MATLDMETVVRLTEEAVAERGADFVYNRAEDGMASCQYVPSTDPRWRETDFPASGSAVTGCLVGAVLDKAGLLSDDIACSALPIDMLIGQGLLGDVSTEVKLFLVRLQGNQDCGKTWGKSLTGAKEYVSWWRTGDV
jgi:hypothetical protein